jgi:thioredoxin 1
LCNLPKAISCCRAYYIPMTQKTENTPTEAKNPREFDEALNRDGKVLVDFYADWCAPCKMMEPAVREVAREGTVEVIKVDIDENQKAASAYGVRSVPTLVLFRDGEAVRRAVGAKSADEIREFVTAQ